jgi:TPR repeat protein
VQPPPAPPEVVYEEYNLGVRYAFGTGVKQDYKKAAELFLKAAMQGLADAQYNLGALYDNGLGVAKDPVRAVIWYHSAAEQNHPSAELNLGLAYANGTGVAQDYAEAARWFRRAADQGVVTAQYNLAALYANGRGVEESRVDAYAWFNIAAASGDLEARDQMRRAAETMTAQQLKAARALAVKLAEGVKRPIPGTVSKAANSPGENPQTATAKSEASAEPATAAPAAQPSTPTQPVDQAQVAEIQRYLARLQFDPGPSDGVLNGQTAEAIRKYQTDRKLKVDGEPSRTLLFRLKADVDRLQKP